MDVLAKVTDDYRKYLAQLTAKVITGWDPTPLYYRFGEGGWRDRGAGPEQRLPVSDLRLLTPPNLQDLDSLVDPTRLVIDRRYPVTSLATITKSLAPGDYSYVADYTGKFRCFLDFGEFNNDGFGSFPEIWEVGLFADHPLYFGQKLMVAYGTFINAFVKTGAVQLIRYVKVIF